MLPRGRLLSQRCRSLAAAHQTHCADDDNTIYVQRESGGGSLAFSRVSPAGRPRPVLAPTRLRPEIRSQVSPFVYPLPSSAACVCSATRLPSWAQTSGAPIAAWTARTVLICVEGRSRREAPALPPPCTTLCLLRESSRAFARFGVLFCQSLLAHLVTMRSIRVSSSGMPRARRCSRSLRRHRSPPKPGNGFVLDSSLFRMRRTRPRPHRRSPMLLNTEGP
jgi:hypothetical protein